MKPEFGIQFEIITVAVALNKARPTIKVKTKSKKKKRDDLLYLWTSRNVSTIFRKASLAW